MGKQWTRADESYLRREYSQQTIEALASRLNCTTVAVRSRARKLGVKCGRRRHWTERERQVLITFYRERGARWCAHRLSRSLSQIYQQADRLRLMTKRQVASNDQIRDAVLRYHPLGYCDREIAAEIAQESGLSVERHRVGAIRRQLHLPSNHDSDRRRDAVRQKTNEQLQQAGLDSMGELRKVAWSKWKNRHGWPEHLTVRAVQAMELFHRHGQLTRSQLCELMGVQSRRRTSPTSNSPQGTVLGELQAAGLITRLAKAVRIPGDMRLHEETPDAAKRVNRFKYIDLYFINPGVQPNYGQRTEAS